MRVRPGRRVRTDDHHQDSGHHFDFRSAGDNPPATTAPVLVEPSTEQFEEWALVSAVLMAGSPLGPEALGAEVWLEVLVRATRATCSSLAAGETLSDAMTAMVEDPLVRVRVADDPGGGFTLMLAVIPGGTEIYCPTVSPALPPIPARRPWSSRAHGRSPKGEPRSTPKGGSPTAPGRWVSTSNLAPTGSAGSTAATGRALRVLRGQFRPYRQWVQRRPGDRHHPPHRRRVPQRRLRPLDPGRIIPPASVAAVPPCRFPPPCSEDLSQMVPSEPPRDNPR